MTAVLVRARSELRARLPAVLALAVLLGLGAGAVMTLAAGARRTDSAYGRFARAHNAADMLIFPAFDQSFANLDFDKVSALPQVLASARQYYLGTPDDQDLEILAGDAAYGTTVDRMKILEGRAPRPDSLDEVVVGFSVAKKRHLHVGSLLHTKFGVTFTEEIPWTLRVVGIEAAPGEFPPQFENTTPGAGGVVHVSPGLYQTLKARKVFTFEFLLLRLKHGSADIRDMNVALNNMANETSNGLPQLNQNLGEQAANVQRSIHLQAVALRIVSGLVALIGLLVLSQLLARQAAIDATDSPTLSALGMSRPQVWLTGMGRSAVIGIVGAVIGVVVAFVASPLMPIGTARSAETNPGLAFDPTVLGIGAAAAIVLVLALAAWPVWKNTKTVQRASTLGGSSKPSLAARTAAIPGFPPPVTTGMRLALEPGRGPTEIPVRSSLMSVILAIVALAGALTFGAGLDHLLETPHSYGWNWDVHASNTTENGTADAALRALGPDPIVEDIASVDTPPMRLGGQVFDMIALSQKKGVIDPVRLEGHLPRTPTEVALGVKTLRDAHAHIGSTVELSITAISGPKATFTVVGTVVIPPNSDTARLGSGGVMLYESVKRLIPPDFTHLPPLTDLYIKFAPGVSKTQALAHIRTVIGKDYDIVLPTRPGDLVNFGQVQNLPLLLAGLIAVLAAATLAHTLVTSIRRRRRDLAILKMLGFVPSQVRWAVAWQATTFISVALLIGLPIGIAVGRLVWTAFAQGLGTVAEPVTPWVLKLLLTIPGTIVLANLIAAIPAVIAGRMKPAPALRAE